MRHSIEPIVVRPADACRLLGVGVTKIYQMMNDGTLESFAEGGARYILTASIRAWVDSNLKKSGPPVQRRSARGRSTAPVRRKSVPMKS
jgi:hypothetical protein